MDRKEAVGILKNILDWCSTEKVTKVMIMPSSTDNSTSDGSQIYMEAAFDDDTKKQLHAIVRQHNLAIKEEANRIIIYTPLQIIRQ